MILKIKKFFIYKFLSKIKLNIFKNIFFISSISYFIYYFILNNQNITFKLEKQYYFIYLLLALICCFLSIFFNGLAWRNITIWFNQSSNEKNLVSFYILTNSLKYVPGGIWHFIERFNFLKYKFSSNVAFYTNLIEPYFMVSTSLLLATIGVYLNPLFLLFCLPCVFLHRNLIYYLLIKLDLFKNRSKEFLKIGTIRNQFKSSIEIKTTFPFEVLLIEILFILFKFSGFILCYYIFNHESSLNVIFIFVVFCLSWSIGLIIPAAPGGLGVFEASFLFLIGNVDIKNTVILSLIFFRCIATFADLILSSPFLIKKLLIRKN